MNTKMDWKINPRPSRVCVGGLEIGDWFIYDGLPAILLDRPRAGWFNGDFAPEKSKPDHDILFFGANGLHRHKLDKFTQVDKVGSVKLEMILA